VHYCCMLLQPTATQRLDTWFSSLPGGEGFSRATVSVGAESKPVCCIKTSTDVTDWDTFYTQARPGLILTTRSYTSESVLTLHLI